MGIAEIIMSISFLTIIVLFFIFDKGTKCKKHKFNTKKQYINLLDCLIDKQETVSGMMHQIKELNRFRSEKHIPITLIHLVNQKIDINTELIRRIYENTN